MNEILNIFLEKIQALTPIYVSAADVCIYTLDEYEIRITRTSPSSFVIQYNNYQDFIELEQNYYSIEMAFMFDELRRLNPLPIEKTLEELISEFTPENNE